MLSSHLILCHPLLLLPPVLPSIRVFSNESTLCIRWPKYWSFSFSISPSNEYLGLISFRMDWFDLLAVQESLNMHVYICLYSFSHSFLLWETFTNYYRNANQSYNEVSSHTSQNGHHHKLYNNKCWRMCGENIYYWWEYKLVQSLWRTVWRYLKKLKMELPYDSAFLFLGRNHNSKGCMHPSVDCSTIYNSHDMEKT